MKTYAADALHRLRLTLNGVPRDAHAEPRTLLSDLLRHELGATGTHVGCEHGVCGACTVLIDGEPARACLTLALQADGRALTTVEGLAAGADGGGGDGMLNALQAAFRRHHALQCGFCTAGILNAATAWLARVATGEVQPTEAAVRDMLSGHLCRCTGYTPIVAAILETAQARVPNDVVGAAE
jgi:2-furoyl-CoA dehydrogenase 2Fe-2S iron sulfur subunit